MNSLTAREVTLLQGEENGEEGDEARPWTTVDVRMHVHVADSPAILMGRIFDDRGNRMTPSHSNKAGVRYRYYVSQALLQRRKDEAGGVARVPAAQVEATVVEAVRQSLRKNAPTKGHSDVSDREAIDRFVERIVISPKSIEIHLREARAVEATETNRSSAAPHARDSDEDTAIAPAPVITVPWNAPAFVSVKGVLHHRMMERTQRMLPERSRSINSGAKLPLPRGNVAGSPTRGNPTAETTMAG
jgi:hypothetical protein